MSRTPEQIELGNLRCCVIGHFQRAIDELKQGSLNLRQSDEQHDCMNDTCYRIDKTIELLNLARPLAEKLEVVEKAVCEKYKLEYPPRDDEPTFKPEDYRPPEGGEA